MFQNFSLRCPWLWSYQNGPGSLSGSPKSQLFSIFFVLTCLRSYNKHYKHLYLSRFSQFTLRGNRKDSQIGLKRFTLILEKDCGRTAKLGLAVSV